MIIYDTGRNSWHKFNILSYYPDKFQCVKSGTRFCYDAKKQKGAKLKKFDVLFYVRSYEINLRDRRPQSVFFWDISLRWKRFNDWS